MSVINITGYVAEWDVNNENRIKSTYFVAFSLIMYAASSLFTPVSNYNAYNYSIYVLIRINYHNTPFRKVRHFGYRASFSCMWHQLKAASQSRKRSSIAKVTYFPGACIEHPKYWRFWGHVQRRIFIFSFRGWINIWGGGCCCLLWPGPGGNARKGQGKSLTKFVF
jgi:hypothetical protein